VEHVVILGGYVFPWKPDRFTIPRGEKESSLAMGLGVLGYLAEDSILESKEIVLEWDWVSVVQFQALQALYEADEAIVWDVFGGGI
jgi:hypothetical protein